MIERISLIPNDETKIKPVNIEEHLNDVIQNRKRIKESLEKKIGRGYEI